VRSVMPYYNKMMMMMMMMMIASVAFDFLHTRDHKTEPGFELAINVQCNAHLLTGTAVVLLLIPPSNSYSLSLQLMSGMV